MRDREVATHHPILGQTNAQNLGVVMLLRKGLSMPDVGEYRDADAKQLYRIDELRNSTEVLRRLHLPHYEEARMYFKRAKESGDMDGINEVACIYPTRLSAIVEDYAEN